MAKNKSNVLRFALIPLALVVTSKHVTPSLSTEIGSKASQLCKTDSKDFALAVHIVRQEERNVAPVRLKLNLIFFNKSVRFGENWIRLEAAEVPDC